MTTDTNYSPTTGAVMDKFKLWQDQLLSRVGQGVQQHGFENRPKRQSFSKRFPIGRSKFHLSFIEHEEDFDVTSDVAIRFDQVEELVNREDKFLTKSEKAETSTVGCELGNLSDGRQKRWTVLTANDVPFVADAIVSAFNELGLPYIEQFSDFNHVLEVLSGDGPDSWLHAPLHEQRAKRAVVMALLTHGKDAARKLVKSKLSFLEERKDFGLPSFRAFLEKIGLSP